jgi:hypothetical protein
MSFAAAQESTRLRSRRFQRASSKQERVRSCQRCRDRKARFQYRGAVRADRDHTLCFECYRSERNRQRALRLADVDSRPPLRSPFKRTELSPGQIAHRRAMLAHFQGGTGQRRAAI